jgi:integrase
VELLAADDESLWRQINIRRGLKCEVRARILPITPAMRDVLVRQMKRSKGKLVFSALDNRRKPLSDNTLSGQARDMKRRVKFHHDAGLHTLRHTYLTEMGKSTDVFSRQKIAGHA